MDLPRRIVAATTNDDYSYKDAIQFFGTQPYKSVVGDEYAKAHPKTAMAADIGTGLLAWNLPGITKSIAGTGMNVMRSEAALAAASDDIAKIAGSGNAGVMKAGVKAANKASRGANPKTNDFLSRAVSTGEGKATNMGGGNVKTSTQTGKVAKGTGTQNNASGKWMQQSRPVNSGKVGGQRQGGGYSGTATYAIPHAPIVPWKPIPIPGLPGGIPPPVVTERQKRIESKVPFQKTTGQLFIENNVAEGDTMVLPSGEMIKRVTGADSTWVPRIHDFMATKTYDQNSNDVTQQKKIPRASYNTYGVKGKNSVGSYYPGVPASEERDEEYYPEQVTGKTTYKPILFRKEGGKINWLKYGGKMKKAQEGDKMKNGKPLKSSFKKTTYAKEEARLDNKKDSLSNELTKPKVGFFKKNKLKNQIGNTERAMADLKKSKPAEKEKGGKVKKKDWLKKNKGKYIK